MIRSLPADTVLEALLAALERADVGCTVVIDHGDRLERVYANAPLARIYGRTLEEVRALPPMDMLAPSELERVEEARAWGGPMRIETKVVDGAGAEVPIDLALGYAPLVGARAAFAFIRDISAKAKMEGALRESEERFRRVAEASPDLVTIFSNGRYVYANPVALRYLGLASLDELASFDPWSTVPEDLRAEVLERNERLRQGATARSLQIHGAGADGRKVTLENSISHTTLNGVPAVISYTRDITERVQLQAELMKQDRLAAVGLLAAGVAHELNNPLASLALQTRKLRHDADEHGFSPEVRRSLEQMHDTVDHMKTIISDLLFMARPTDWPQTHVELAQILTSTIALLRAGTPDCPPIHADIDALPPIQGYPSKLGQVFLNVLRNAVQAVEAVPGGEVRVRGRAQGEAIEIAVADNGVGIPEDLVRRVTEPFFTTKPNGTGLGLWISQTLVAQHGGSLDVESAEGRGATVTIRLRETLPRP